MSRVARYLVAVCAVTIAGCGLAHSIHARLTPQGRYYGMAFLVYKGPLQPKFVARATVEVPKTARPSSPSIQLHLVQGHESIEGGLWRKRGNSTLRAFATDIVAGRGVLRLLGPVSDGPHVISIRGNEGLIEFLVDGEAPYVFSAHFPMDRNSAVTIGTFVSKAGDRPMGSISNLSVSANDGDMRTPACVLESGGISLERRGSKWRAEGEYDPAKPGIDTGCNR